jgi:anti-sigma B factor antagonist
MSLEISRRDREDIAILDLKGRITMGDEVSAFRSAVGELSAQSGQKAIINMGAVDYIDSTGLGAIVMCSTTIKKNGGVAKLLNLNRRTVELLVTTKLATIFEIFDDEQDAVNSFFPGREIKGFDILQFVKSHKQS